MKTLQVYLTFNGNCKEAMNFYKDAIGGEIVSMQSFGDSQMPYDEDQKDQIIHSEFRSENIYFMASDNMKGTPYFSGTNVSLSIDMTDQDEQTKIFNNLANGGRINMELQDTFWGARFGMCTDKYGMNWMLNCNKQKSE